MLNKSPNVIAIISGWSRHGVPSWWMISQSSSTSFKICAAAFLPRMSVKEPATGLKLNIYFKKCIIKNSIFVNYIIIIIIFILKTHLPYSSFENFCFSMFKPEVNGFLFCLSLCLFAYWSNIATLSLSFSWKKKKSLNHRNSN